MGLKSFLQKIKKTFSSFNKWKSKKYLIGKYQIEIPLNYCLPLYQSNYKLYDRFLPVLVKYISSNKIIIDVGANIGDTVIGILQNCINPIVCIEPSDIFLPYLYKNLGNLPDEYVKRVKVYEYLVGTGAIQGSLNHTTAGTASLNVATDKSLNTHVALDKIMEEKKSDIVLIKVDTDGFDFDVIRSSSQILKSSEPILFWENEIRHDFQIAEFKKMYSELVENGYKYIYIFDNFGNLMIEECSNFQTLNDINVYIYSQIKYKCTKTLYYTDILASTEKNISLVRDAVKFYKKNWIEKISGCTIE